MKVRLRKLTTEAAGEMHLDLSRLTPWSTSVELSMDMEMEGPGRGGSQVMTTHFTMTMNLEGN